MTYIIICQYVSS